MNEEQLRLQFGNVDKVLAYFDTEYHYSVEDLKWLDGIYAMLDSLHLHDFLDPQTSEAEQMMRQCIDNFMRDSDRRRRRSY
jgi:hypothetical protein